MTERELRLCKRGQPVICNGRTFKGAGEVVSVFLGGAEYNKPIGVYVKPVKPDAPILLLSLDEVTLREGE